jgi:type 1 fimbriae regulatory protein FimB
MEANPMKYWTPAELLRILEEAKKRSARNHCMILLAYKHGLRATEVCRLTLEDVADGRLDCKRLKGSLHTNRPLESHVNPLLDEKRGLAAWLREREDTGSTFLFISRLGSAMTRDAFADIVEDAAMRAGIERGRRHPHCAKHTLGRNAYKVGLGVLDIQQLLGHRDIKASACYTSVTQDEAHEKAKSAMAGIFA